jgi:hypothetical protein
MRYCVQHLIETVQLRSGGFLVKRQLLPQREKLIQRMLNRKLFEMRKSRFLRQRPRALFADHCAQPRAIVRKRNRHAMHRADRMKHFPDGVAILMRVRRGVWL